MAVRPDVGPRAVDGEGAGAPRQPLLGDEQWMGRTGHIKNLHPAVVGREIEVLLVLGQRLGFTVQRQAAHEARRLGRGDIHHSQARPGVGEVGRVALQGDGSTGMARFISPDRQRARRQRHAPRLGIVDRRGHLCIQRSGVVEGLDHFRTQLPGETRFVALPVDDAEAHPVERSLQRPALHHALHGAIALDAAPQQDLIVGTHIEVGLERLVDHVLAQLDQLAPQM